MITENRSKTICIQKIPKQNVYKVVKYHFKKKQKSTKIQSQQITVRFSIFCWM